VRKISTRLWFDGGIEGAASREQGTRGLVENLVKYLQS